MPEFYTGGLGSPTVPLSLQESVLTQANGDPAFLIAGTFFFLFALLGIPLIASLTNGAARSLFSRDHAPGLPIEKVKHEDRRRAA